MSSYLFFDLETTGVTDNSAPIEIAIIPVINGEIHAHYHSYIRPHEGASVDPKAFEVNGIDPKSIWTFPDANDVVREIIEFIDSHETIFTVAGHNVSFDSKFLYKLFCRTGNYSNYVTRFSPNELCTLKLARNVFKNKRKKPEGFSLGKLCKHFEIKLDNAHSALPDIKATIQLYDQLCSLSEPKHKETEKLTYHQQRNKYMAVDYLTINPEGDCYIHNKATKDPEAMRFILNELWRITQSHENEYSTPREVATPGDSWPESWDAH